MSQVAASDARPMAPAGRRLYIDWLRGVAVFIMIMWHVVDSWHVREARDTASFGFLIFVAGWAAPLFLFLAGVSVPMAGVARIARGATRQEALQSLVRRGWQVFLIAHLFRLQSFLLNPSARWSGLLKPDILNILGLGLVAVAYAWSRSDSTRRRLVWLLGPAVLIAGVLAPLAPTWWWPTLLHPRLEAYIRPVGNMGVFSLFPAVAYVFAGAFVGACLADRRDTDEAPFHRRALAWGAGLVTLGVLLSLAPLSRAERLWWGPLTVVSWRTGAMVTLVAASWWWCRSRAPRALSPLMVFGRTSLFVYWVHVELAYGAFSAPLRNSLTLPVTLMAYVLFTALLYWVAMLWMRRPAGPLIPAHMRASA